MPITYPNRRCTCGFNRFRESTQRINESVDRWMLFGEKGGGFGATPFGTFFGASPGGTWGLFPGNYTAAAFSVTCENCNRVRSQATLGGITPLGIYVEGDQIFVAAADVALPVTCYSLRLEGPEGVQLTTPLSYVPGTPPAIYAPAPGTVAETPPPGASTVDTLLAAQIPDVPVTGQYTVVLVDRCCGCETTLVTITLEASIMIFSPLDADIGGAPRDWIFQNHRVLMDAAQPAGNTRPSIPFDKCTAVIEYDARSGALPSAEGWTRVGTGLLSDWALVEGGALRVGTTSPNTNYWEKTLAPAVALAQVYAYASVLGDIAAGAIGSGLDVQGLYRSAVIPYSGVRMSYRDRRVFYTRLDTSAQVQLNTDQNASQWVTMYGADQSGGDEIGGENRSTGSVAELLPASSYDTVGVPGANALVARFGNTVGAPTLVGLFREVVVSGPGRFIRARFAGVAPSSTPVLRLYLVADANSSPLKTVRIKVNYGPGTGNPYGPLPYTAGATINMLVPNTVYEIPLSFTGLTANQPVWFSVEREWDHINDQLDATAHLIQATLRLT